MKTIIAIAGLTILTGCATTGGDYDSYLKAQTAANQQAVADQKPLVRLTAQPGQTITGLASLEVYTPTSAPVIQQARPSEWAAVLGQGISVLGNVGGIIAGGKAAIGLASEVRQAGTAGYAHIQAPTTTTTTTMTGSTGVLGSGQYAIDSTHAPTVVNQPAPLIVRPEVVNPVVVNPVVVQAPAGN